MPRDLVLRGIRKLKKKGPFKKKTEETLPGTVRGVLDDSTIDDAMDTAAVNEIMVKKGKKKGKKKMTIMRGGGGGGEALSPSRSSIPSPPAQAPPPPAAPHAPMPGTIPPPPPPPAPQAPLKSASLPPPPPGPVKPNLPTEPVYIEIVPFNGSQISLKVADSTKEFKEFIKNCTVGQFKKMIEDKTGIKQENHRLSHSLPTKGNRRLQYSYLETVLRLWSYRST